MPRMCFSMQGKPLYSAGGAAKSRALVFGIAHLDEDAAVSAAKRSGYGPGLHVLRMFPIQPFAVGRAKLRPFIPFVGDADDLAAPHALKCSQCVRPIGGRDPLYQSVPMSISPAKRTAVFLRAPSGDKHRPAHRAFSNSFHSPSLTFSSSTGKRLPRMPQS